MRNNASVKSHSSVYGMIASCHMSEHDRHEAWLAMRDADLFSDGLVWTMRKIEALSGHLFGGAAVKH